MDRYYTGRIFLLLGCLIGRIHAQCTGDPAVTGITYHKVIEGEIVVGECTTASTFNTNDQAITVKCRDGAWDTFSATCPAPAMPLTTCSADPVVPNAEIDTDLSTGTNFKVMKCNAGMSWLTGEKYQITQCRDQAWTTINDVCDTPCEVPRECSDVAALGFKTTGWYYIIPSGDINDAAKLAYCEIAITDSASERNWTVILMNDVNPMTKTAREFQNGFGNASTDTQYFIGLNTLAGWGQESNHMRMILEARVTDNDGNVYVSSWDDFRVGPAPNYVLESIGNYHGNAGDVFCPLVQTAFLAAALDTTARIYYWGLPSGDPSGEEFQAYQDMIKEQGGHYATEKATSWFGLPTDTVVSVEFRAAWYDIQVNISKTQCPPRYGSSYLHHHTRIDFDNDSHRNRSVGQKIFYECIGDLQKVGNSANKLSTFGEITCELINDIPTWNPNDIILPCTLHCPSNYKISDDGTTCYRYSDTSEKADGLLDATHKCLKERATLAIINSYEDFEPAAIDVNYYTGHSHANSQTKIPLAATLVPDGTKVVDSSTADPGCDTVVKTAAATSGDPSILTFQTGKCNETLHFICQRPGTCPTGYRLALGGCYKTIETTESMLDAYTTCTADGAGLFYPQTYNQSDDAINEYISPNMTNNTFFYMGLNMADLEGTWNLYSTYNVDEDVSSNINNSLKDGLWTVGYTEFHTDGKEFQVFSHENPFIVDTSITKATCQFPGPFECGEFATNSTPPVATANMMQTWDETTILHAEATYSCYPGYYNYVNTTISFYNRTQKYICIGQLGGWYNLQYDTFKPCTIYPVCENQEANVTFAKEWVTNITNDDSFNLNGTVTYVCPDKMGMYNDTGSTYHGTEMNCTCTEIAANEYAFFPFIYACDVCLESPIFVNATTNFVNETSRVDTYVTATCDNKTEFKYYQNGTSKTQERIYCTAEGWNWTNVQEGCKKSCTYDPPLAQDNMIRDNFTTRVLGMQINYTCADGYNIRPTEDNPQPDINTTHVLCDDDHTWGLQRPNDTLECVKVCQAEPPAIPANGNWNYNGFSRSENDSITYTCDHSYLYPDYNITANYTCNGTHWVGPSPEKFVCNRACLHPLNTTYGGGNTDWVDPFIPGWVDERVNYTCPENQATKLGAYTTSTDCAADGNWTTLDPTYQCYNACATHPELPPPMSTYNYSLIKPDYTDGVCIEYICPGYFVTGNYSIMSCCDNFNWTNSPLPICQPVTTPGPTPEIVLEEIPGGLEAVKYENTATYYWGEAKHGLEDASGSGTNFYTGDGPFGFGNAIQLNQEGVHQEQCVNKSIYQKAGEICTTNPKFCNENGTSFSLWVHFDFEYTFGNDLDADLANKTIYEYYISTGGDETHPGIAIYRAGVMICALVNNEAMYWKACSVIPGWASEGWTNIGVAWKPDISKYKGEDVGGLMLYMNLKRVAWLQLGTAVTPPPGQTLSPPEIMIGCHKTQSEPEYWGYSSSMMDEIAIWSRMFLLPSEDPENEDSYLFFAGGHQENASSIELDVLAQMIDKIDTSRPGQLELVLEIVMGGMPDEPEPVTTTVAPTLDPSDPNPPTTEAPTEAPTTSATPTVDDDTNFNGYVGILGTLTDITKVAPIVPVEALSIILKMADFASNLFNCDNTNKWKAFQTRDPDHEGGIGLFVAQSDYFMKALENVRYTNVSEIIRLTKLTPYMFIQMRKSYVEYFYRFGDRKTIPERHPLDAESLTEELENTWDMPVGNKVQVTTVNIFDDDRCDKRPVNTIVTASRCVAKYADLRVNPANLDEEVHRVIDSMIMYVEISVDEPIEYDGSRDPYGPECQINMLHMKEHPLSFRLKHIDNMPASKQGTVVQSRDLKFHENEDYTDVLERHCVRWNRNLSDFGAWDKEGCNLVETNKEFTTCNCDGFGVFAIVADKLDPIAVPEEPQWAMILKYVFYSISAILLCIYIAVIVMSSDLKEQFHLMGMHLSISVLIGSICMIVTDFEMIREDRHLNVAFGTMVHYFYAAEGCWVACLGFASFKAITSGIIGGKLKAYCLISWGLPVMLIGLPFMLFLHDLGRDPRCFLSWENHVKIIFFAPQAFMCLIGFFCAIVVLSNMSTPALRKENLIADYGSFCRGAAVIMLYIGISWVFGYFAYYRFDKKLEIPDFYPLFQIFNSLTGIMIFLFIGIYSNRYRTVLAGQAKYRRRQLLDSATMGAKQDKNDKILDNDSFDYTSRSIGSANSQMSYKSNSSLIDSGSIKSRPSIHDRSSARSTPLD